MLLSHIAMYRATVAARHSFGIKADVKDNICYLEEQTVIYPSGHNIVIFNTEQKTQKFIPGTENTEGITAMAVSPNRKYVAVAERAKEGEKAQVTIFDLHTLKRRKVRAGPAVAGALPPPTAGLLLLLLLLLLPWRAGRSPLPPKRIARRRCARPPRTSRPRTPLTHTPRRRRGEGTAIPCETGQPTLTVCPLASFSPVPLPSLSRPSPVLLPSFSRPLPGSASGLGRRGLA